MPALAGSAGFDSAMGAEGGAVAGSLHRPPIPSLESNLCAFHTQLIISKHIEVVLRGCYLVRFSCSPSSIKSHHTYIFKDVWH